MPRALQEHRVHFLEAVGAAAPAPPRRVVVHPLSEAVAAGVETQPRTRPVHQDRQFTAVRGARVHRVQEE